MLDKHQFTTHKQTFIPDHMKMTQQISPSFQVPSHTKQLQTKHSWIDYIHLIPATGAVNRWPQTTLSWHNKDSPTTPSTFLSHSFFGFHDGEIIVVSTEQHVREEEGCALVAPFSGMTCATKNTLRIHFLLLPWVCVHLLLAEPTFAIGARFIEVFASPSCVTSKAGDMLPGKLCHSR